VSSMRTPPTTLTAAPRELRVLPRGR
jgi:hypothetical protein